LKERVKACAGGEYQKIANQIMKKKINLPKSVVNNAKVSDHHAIIPTEQPAMLSELSDKERKVYDLVVKRFLAVLSDPHEYEQMTVEAEIGSETFHAKGKVVKKQGWKVIYDRHFEEDADDGQTLPSLKKGDQLSSLKLVLKQGETKPPERFTEGTLLKAMENPARFMEQDKKHL